MDPKKHPLKDLVVKLNDRNIQRQRESGLTIYAIYGALIYIVFYLIENGPEIINSQALIDNLIVTTMLGNLTFCAAYFIAAIISRKRRKTTKIFPETRFLSTDITDVPVVFFCACFAILNAFSFNYSFTGSWIYLVFAVPFATNLIVPPAVQLVHVFRNRKNTFQFPDFTYFKKSIQRPIQIGMFICGLFLTIIAVHLMLTEKIDIPKSNLPESIKYGMHFIGLFVALGILLAALERKTFHENLEELEKEIFLNDLSESEIKDRLEQEYFGQDFRTWAVKKKAAVSEYLQETVKKLSAIRDRLPRILDTSLELSDRQALYASCFNERESIIKNAQIYNTAFTRLIKNLKYFSSIDNDEWNDFNDLCRVYNEELEKLNVIDRQLYNFFTTS